MAAHTLPFASWESFYVIVGSSAAALTGLQFVVIVLGAEVNAVTKSAMRAFGTPTIIHFGATLLISAILSAPWTAIAPAAYTLGAFALIGMVYMGFVVQHAQRQSDYKPVAEDWIWHFTLPFLGYMILLASVGWMFSRTEAALFGVGAVALLLLFVGIHNAWDAVTYIALDAQRVKEPPPAPPPSAAAPEAMPQPKQEEAPAPAPAVAKQG